MRLNKQTKFAYALVNWHWGGGGQNKKNFHNISQPLPDIDELIIYVCIYISHAGVFTMHHRTKCYVTAYTGPYIITITT
jgi:hypothetical protein